MAEAIPPVHSWSALLVGLALLAAVVELIRRDLLQERYAALWIVMAFVFMTYRLWLAPVAAFAEWAEIGDSVTVVIAVGILMCALLILQLSVKVSEFSLRIKNLTQEVALLQDALAEERGRRRRGDAEVRDEGP